jgi:general secretion pathway protein D
MSAASGDKPHFSIVPDVRSNSLMVRSDSPDQTKRVKDLVDKLDVPGNGQYGNIHVVYLRNADAVKLAETLRSIVESKTTVPATANTGTVTASSGTANPSIGATTQSVSSIIQADQPTNSLIITAPDNVYNSLRAVIDSLDSRRAQIYVEALIAEVSSDKMAELGIQWQTPLNSGSTSQALIGGTNFGSGSSNLVNLSTGAVLPPSGFNLGMIKKMIVGGKEVIGLTALANALQTDANANILSTPNLLTMDNEEAKIVIGKNVPFITGSYAQSAGAAGSAVNPFQTIERKDVGLTLKVKPQVAEGGTVKLKIYQEASSIQDTTNSAGVITNKRSIESTVLVDDGQIIVLGGLMQDDVEDNVQKVPGLGDLPVLGSLFKYETRKRVKTNLMVFLRPKVMRTAEDSHSTTVDRYDYIRNAQKENASQNRTILPNGQRPLLPDIKRTESAVDE